MIADDVTVMHFGIPWYNAYVKSLQIWYVQSPQGQLGPFKMLKDFVIQPKKWSTYDRMVKKTCEIFA